MCPRCVHCFVSLLLQKFANIPLTWFLTSPSIRYPYWPGFFHSPFHSSLHGPQGPQVKRLKFEIIYMYKYIYIYIIIICIYIYIYIYLSHYVYIIVVLLVYYHIYTHEDIIKLCIYDITLLRYMIMYV